MMGHSVPYILKVLITNTNILTFLFAAPVGHTSYQVQLVSRFFCVVFEEKLKELLTVHELRSEKEYERSCLAKILKKLLMCPS